MLDKIQLPIPVIKNSLAKDLNKTLSLVSCFLRVQRYHTELDLFLPLACLHQVVVHQSFQRRGELRPF